MHKIPFVEGEFYHLYNRGVDKRRVFMDESDKERFLAYLYILNTNERISTSDFLRSNSVSDIFRLQLNEPLVAIGAFCLMPNHYHLYVTPLTEGGVSKFLQRLDTAYTKYFNEKYNRTGSLFEGTFKSEHIANENHAKYLFSYIHLNPAKLKDKNWKVSGFKNDIQKFIEAYQYSSYKEYRLNERIIINSNPFPQYLKTKKDIKGHIEDWFQYAQFGGSLASRK